jgi:CubicO group peptidase (beta-lactamase class C family)
VLLDPIAAEVPQGKGTWKWGGVYGHHWYVDPVNRLVVVALTNTAVEGMAGRFVADLMDAVYGSVPTSIPDVPSRTQTDAGRTVDER